MGHLMTEVTIPPLTLNNGSSYYWLDPIVQNDAWTPLNPAHMRFHNATQYILAVSMTQSPDSFVLRPGESILIALGVGETGFSYVCKGILMPAPLNNFLFLTYYATRDIIYEYQTDPIIPVAGATPFKLLSANTTNANSVRQNPTTLYGYDIGNNSTTTDAYLKIYDEATTPVIGTDITTITIYLPHGQRAWLPPSEPGIQLKNGLGIGLTGGISSSDTTAVGANQIIVNLFLGS